MEICQIFWIQQHSQITFAWFVYIHIWFLFIKASILFQTNIYFDHSMPYFHIRVSHADIYWINISLFSAVSQNNNLRNVIITVKYCMLRTKYFLKINQRLFDLYMIFYQGVSFSGVNTAGWTTWCPHWSHDSGSGCDIRTDNQCQLSLPWDHCHPWSNIVSQGWQSVPQYLHLFTFQEQTMTYCDMKKR